MSRIQQAFERAAVTGQKLFLPYLCAGDPDVPTSLELVRTVEEAGADILELGIPFSDPLADGPTIQKATQRSLGKGFRMTEVFEMVNSIRERSDIPLVLMTYYNPVFRYGETRFLTDAREAGADGVLVVDLPPEEGGDFFHNVTDHGLDTVLLVTPTTPVERVRGINELTTGFLYYVSVTGVTGVRSGYNEQLRERIERTADAVDHPMVMGFGVSDIESIRKYLDRLQGVVAGSTLIEAIENNLDDRESMLEEVSRRTRQLANPLHGAAV